MKKICQKRPHNFPKEIPDDYIEKYIINVDANYVDNGIDEYYLEKHGIVPDWKLQHEESLDRRMFRLQGMRDD